MSNRLFFMVRWIFPDALLATQLTMGKDLSLRSR